MLSSTQVGRAGRSIPPGSPVTVAVAGGAGHAAVPSMGAVRMTNESAGAGTAKTGAALVAVAAGAATSKAAKSSGASTMGLP